MFTSIPWLLSIRIPVWLSQMFIDTVQICILVITKGNFHSHWQKHRTFQLTWCSLRHNQSDIIRCSTVLFRQNYTLEENTRTYRSASTFPTHMTRLHVISFTEFCVEITRWLSCHGSPMATFHLRDGPISGPQPFSVTTHALLSVSVSFPPFTDCMPLVWCTLVDILCVDKAAFLSLSPRWRGLPGGGWCPDRRGHPPGCPLCQSAEYYVVDGTPGDHTQLHKCPFGKCHANAILRHKYLHWQGTVQKSTAAGVSDTPIEFGKLLTSDDVLAQSAIIGTLVPWSFLAHSNRWLAEKSYRREDQGANDWVDRSWVSFDLKYYFEEYKEKCQKVFYKDGIHLNRKGLQEPLFSTRFQIVIPTWTSNRMPGKMRNEISYSFANFNDK